MLKKGRNIHLKTENRFWHIDVTSLILTLFSLLFFSPPQSFAYSLSNTNDIIVSPIGNQQVIIGGGINIYFTAFDPVIGAPVFTSNDLPPFAEIINNGDNNGRIAINTSTGQEGEYLFHLQVDGTAGTTIIPIHLTVLEKNLNGTVYYCDPVNGNMNNSGDFDNPWGTLAEVFSNNITFNEGDIIFLRNGHHKSPKISGLNSGAVYIAAQANHTPTLRKISLGTAKNWVISGLEISPESAGAAEIGNYVKLVRNAKNNSIENCHIYAIKNSAIWNIYGWYYTCGDGILNNGEYNTIRNNLITNTYFSATIDGQHNHFDYNIIDRFAGDAIRGLDSYNTFNYNSIMNAVVDDYNESGGNHDDAFQSWTFDTPIFSLEIKGNIVFSCTDPDLPLKTSVMQGIVIFDGFAEDWVVENNLVVQDHPHGIALYGAKNCKLLNNTVIRNPLKLFFNGSHPWVRINKHKDGRHSSGNLVRNNLSGTLFLDAIPGTNDHNSVSTNYNLYLKDYDNWNFHLNNDSPATNSGFLEDSPQVDFENHVRLPSTIPDRGCLENEATLFDFESPTSPKKLQIIETTVSGIILSWEEATDNTGISHYKVKYGDKVISTTGTEVSIYNLQNDTDYDFEIIAVDYSGNISETAFILTKTLPTPTGTFYKVKINAHQDDQQIRSYNKLEWVGMHEHHIGGINSDYDASVVIPFELPTLDNVEEIQYADLKLNFMGVNNFPQGGIDLYGLPARSKSDVSIGDHWQGSFGNDKNATGLVQNYLSATSTSGVIQLDSTAALKIVEFIVEQYQQGAKPENYIFFRLNPNVANESDNSYYRISTADAPKSTERPSLELTLKAKATPTKEIMGELPSLKIYPNPVGQSQLLKVEILNSPYQTINTLLIHDSLGRLVFEKSINTPTTSIYINLIDIKLSSGMYELNLLGAAVNTQTKFIVK